MDRWPSITKTPDAKQLFWGRVSQVMLSQIA